MRRTIDASFEIALDDDERYDLPLHGGQRIEVDRVVGHVRLDGLGSKKELAYVNVSGFLYRKKDGRLGSVRRVAAGPIASLPEHVREMLPKISTATAVIF